jgi:hypothetical protein
MALSLGSSLAVAQEGPALEASGVAADFPEAGGIPGGDISQGEPTEGGRPIVTRAQLTEEEELYLGLHGSTEHGILTEAELATVDEVPPQVQSVTPADGAVGVPINNDRITVQFNEAMDRTTLLNGCIFYTDELGVKQPVNFRLWFESGLQLQFYGLMKPATTYFVHATTDCADIAGNHLQSEFVSSFTTAPDVSDSDGDGIPIGIDNCEDVHNPGQEDSDGDGIGDACNSAFDTDADEWADALDNCPGHANSDQLDQDADGLGDACDPFPGDPDNEQAQCEADLAVTLAELADTRAQLAECRANPPLLDADSDGEIDARDACSATPVGAPIDAAGCSRSQFCAARPAGSLAGVIACFYSDWQNDEPGWYSPEDCKPEINWYGRFRCVAR